MQIVITATVPDEWRDTTLDAGILSAPHDEIVDALIGVGDIENIEIEEKR